jgi:WD40 repeat protein
MATFVTKPCLRLAVFLGVLSASLGLTQEVVPPKDKPPKPPPEKGKLLPEQRAGEVWAVSLARDGRTMAVARGFSDAGAAVQLWDLTEGTKKAIFESPKVVHAVAFSPDGQRLATGGFDNVLRIFDVASGKMLHELHGHQAGVTSLA